VANPRVEDGYRTEQSVIFNGTINYNRQPVNFLLKKMGLVPGVLAVSAEVKTAEIL